MRQLQFVFLLFSIFIFCVWSSSSPPICTNGFTLVNNKCLKLYTNAVTYKAAERTCMDYGATLVTVKNAYDNNAIASFVGSSASLLWLGIYCFDSDPSRCLWDDSSLGSADVYDNFASGFPRVEIGKCVYYSVRGALAGQWLSGECEEETRAFICELPSTHADSCEYNYGGHCYTFHNNTVNFVQAQTACEQECGNLASITSPNENRYITTHAAIGNYYIGAMWPSPNFLSWIDGSVWSYNNIDPDYGQRGQTCMVLSALSSTHAPPFGFWCSVPCNIGYYFICKRPAGIKCNGSPPPVVVTPVPSNPPSNCNSSLVLAPGVITSPNYPSNYSNNLYCIYNLATIGSFNVLLKIESFNTELNHDIVSIYDGDSIDSPLLVKFSGTTATNVVSTGNTMTVVFQTDNVNVAQGFSASVRSYSSRKFN